MSDDFEAATRWEYHRLFGGHAQDNIDPVKWAQAQRAVLASRPYGRSPLSPEARDEIIREGLPEISGSASDFDK